MDWKTRYTKKVLCVGAILEGTTADIRGLKLEVLEIKTRGYLVLKTLENANSGLRRFANVDNDEEFKVGGIFDRDNAWENCYKIVG